MARGSLPLQGRSFLAMAQNYPFLVRHRALAPSLKDEERPRESIMRPNCSRTRATRLSARLRKSTGLMGHQHAYSAGTAIIPLLSERAAPCATSRHRCRPESEWWQQTAYNRPSACRNVLISSEKGVADP